MLKIGDKVRHKHRPDVGIGEVVDIMGNNKCTVQFDKCIFTAISYESIGSVEDVEKEMFLNLEKIKKEKIIYEEKFMTPRQIDNYRFARNQKEISEILNSYKLNNDVKSAALKIENIIIYDACSGIYELLKRVPIEVRLQFPVFTKLSKADQFEVQFLGHQLEIKKIVNLYKTNGDVENASFQIANILECYADKNIEALLKGVPIEVQLQSPIFTKLSKEAQLQVQFLGHELEIEEIVNVYKTSGDLERAALRIENIIKCNTDTSIQKLLKRVPVEIRLQPPIFKKLSRVDQIETQFLGHQIEIKKILNSYNKNNDLENTALKVSKILAVYDHNDSKSKVKILLQMLPVKIRLQNSVLATLVQEEQIDIAWKHLTVFPVGLWNNLPIEMRIKLIFRSIKENRRGALPFNSENEDSILKAVMLFLRSAPRVDQETFCQAHVFLENWVISQAWTSSNPIDFSPLLPSCEGGLGRQVYCEGRRWLKSDQQGEVQRSAYCPRKAEECLVARIEADKFRDWNEWSLLEFLSAIGATPILQGLRDPSRYVPQLCGWVNRLNEIRERLKCSKCQEMMIPNRSYAKFLARFNVTVVSCRHRGCHDHNIYLNQCWACGGIIDSRESRHREDDYYVCIHCGSGPKQSASYSQGDMCPNCGTREALSSIGSSRKRCCEYCGHIITLPHQDRLTGIGADKKARNREFFSDLQVFE